MIIGNTKKEIMMKHKNVKKCKGLIAATLALIISVLSTGSLEVGERQI